MQQLSIPKTEHSVIAHQQVEDDLNLLNSLHDIQITNPGGAFLLDRDYSGSLDLDAVTIAVDKLSAAASIIFFDDGVDYAKTLEKHLGRGFSHPGFSNRPDLMFYFDEANHFAESYKIRHDMPYKELQWMPPAHKPGETPRGTKPSFTSGKKKSKQQRAALKARRKQR